jgi:diacylglycerol kinase family enzyme
MAAATLTDPLQRLEAALGIGTDGPKRRMLVIVNPYATTVSDRLKNLVVYALRGTYEVTAIETEARHHATELCREAAAEGYDVVVAFGGDGTVNEAANGLVGTGIPLTCLPGGRANVFCRMLGIPTDVVDATEHLLRIADAFEPRVVDLGRLNDRYFAFSAGVGLDADVVQKVDARPQLKARLGEWFYTWTALRTFHRRYLLHPPRLMAVVGSEQAVGISAIIQNGSPYTYFGDRPVRMAQGTELDSGELTGIVLERASVIDLPTIVWRALSERAALPDHRRVRGFGPVRELQVRSCDARPLSLQVDGDYIGEASEAAFSLRPGGLAVVS